MVKESEVKHFCDSFFHDIIKTAVYARVRGTQYFNSLNVGITFEQFIALDTISKNSDICQRDLSKLILKDRSNTGRILNILEENGFILRNAETKNNRLIKKIKITQKGIDFLKKNEPIIKKNSEHVFDGIPQEDFDSLRRILKTIRECISQNTSLQI